MKGESSPSVYEISVGNQFCPLNLKHRLPRCSVVLPAVQGAPPPPSRASPDGVFVCFPDKCKNRIRRRHILSIPAFRNRGHYIPPSVLPASGFGSERKTLPLSPLTGKLPCLRVQHITFFAACQENCRSFFRLTHEFFGSNADKFGVSPSIPPNRLTKFDFFATIKMPP